MTELAYLADPPAAYVRTFRSRVVARPPGALILDRTFFYPAGGGQPGDRGTVQGPGGSVDVVDVTKSGASVVHRVKGPADALGALTVGTEIDGAVDWARRFRHMRLHTGQHFLSGRIFVRAGLRTRRATMGGLEAILDLEGPVAEELLVPLAADLAEAVRTPRPVSIRYVPRAEWDAHPAAARAGLVPLPPAVDPVRVVEIEAADVCPCGGTHLASTGELGRIALRADRAGERVVLTLDADGPPIPGP
ncbi:MAG TPA: alanyl-tRNA editing protein [Thermoplasmata archaeon]|nr:alanyl-tRNA editing protein [Thermoplasmata archaeon]